MSERPGPHVMWGMGWDWWDKAGTHLNGTNTTSNNGTNKTIQNATTTILVPSTSNHTPIASFVRVGSQFVAVRLADAAVAVIWFHPIDFATHPAL